MEKNYEILLLNVYGDWRLRIGDWGHSQFPNEFTNIFYKRIKNELNN